MRLHLFYPRPLRSVGLFGAFSWTALAVLVSAMAPAALGVGAQSIDFSRQIRPILSENCFFCHGPDEAKREAGLRLDDEIEAKKDRDGVIAVVPGDPEASAIIERITTKDPDDIMPPLKLHKTVNAKDLALLKEWIRQGAPWGKHWSYELPKKFEVPKIAAAKGQPIDAFLMERLQCEGLSYSAAAEGSTLIRRVALDLTGLPPSLEELQKFANAADAAVYRTMVDYYLARPAFGEHWARQWLDLARYADSAGYPSDPGREIWGYRDWVIRALNDNLPFDQFTIDQLSGDLLPAPTDEQLIATAFHRNTMTQNEGGTDDEEYRTAAVIDRVNTTLAVWMGTTMACAQCHTHKYDPITNKEYFEFYAFLNQSEDADRKDEAPLHPFYPPDVKPLRDARLAEVKQLDQKFAQPQAAWLAGWEKWESELPVNAKWTSPTPISASSSSGTALTVQPDGRVLAAAPAKATDIYSVEIAAPSGNLNAFRLEALADASLPGNGPGYASGNFVVSQLQAELLPANAKPARARHLRVELISDKYDFLALAEVQIYSGTSNVALKGKATQISTAPDGPDARLAIDGNTNGDGAKGKSVSVTGGGEEMQWWQVDLGQAEDIDRIVIWKRTDKGQGQFIGHLRLILLDDQQQPVWLTDHKKTFAAREDITVSGRREILFATAFADAKQQGFDPQQAISGEVVKDKGWAIAGHSGQTRTMTIIPSKPETLQDGDRLWITIKQESRFAKHTLGAFRISTCDDARVATFAKIPAPVLKALHIPREQRKLAEIAEIREYYVREVAPESKVERARYAVLQKELENLKPATVPMMKELPAEKRRKSFVQLRGNWRDLGAEVFAGTPAVFHPLPADAPRDRLTMAKWLVSPKNPLTARVTVNRMWESLFGYGIVRSSEEFGSQGELPFHPELLDWLAVEFMDSGWDMKHMLRLMVNTQAYRQTSRSSAELNELDPDNRLLARGPRFRPTGELLRDQALAVSGLLSPKMFGKPVRPLRPDLELKTAFGGTNDWKTSEGEDRHRRSIYTETKRNSPYPSFTTFDATNREVCTIRRGRTNTPLQAFVTLNDPVFVEANQALARRIVAWPNLTTNEDRLKLLWRLCLAREADPSEVSTLAELRADALAHYRVHPADAEKLATDPIGPLPKGADASELASWTAVANVVMNLDEFLMRR